MISGSRGLLEAVVNFHGVLVAWFVKRLNQRPVLGIYWWEFDFVRHFGYFIFSKFKTFKI